jgi:hypothetical protein
MRVLPLVFFALGVACAKQEPPAPAATPAPSVAPAAPSTVASATEPAPSASAAANEDVPIEEDFEDEASKDVTATSLDAQLDALEKEIKAD